MKKIEKDTRNIGYKKKKKKKKIQAPLRGRSISLITRMITDRIGLHSILLSL